MRGQMGFVLLIAGAMLIGGCKHQTPEQKAQAKLQKQEAAEAKAQAKRDAEQGKKDKAAAEAQAKADQQAADAQTKADAKAAKERAEQEKKQAALDAEYKKKYPYGPFVDDKLKVIGYPYILPENRTHYLDQFVEAMSASGAAYEAMLFDYDFTGAMLNGAGRSRLGLMLMDMPADQPATVYVVASGAEERTNALVATVDQAIKEMKPDSRISVKLGANPMISAPAAGGLNALRRMEKQQSQSSQSGGTMNQSTSSMNTPVNP